jgi:lipopolysaccharide export system permease protein
MTFSSPSRRRLGSTLRWYVIRELFFPTSLSLAGLTALVLTKDLLGFSDLVINRGFGASVVAWIALYEIVPLLMRTLPFAFLIGALVGLGRLRADLEILSIEASGLSGRRLVGPVLAFATTLTVVGFCLSLYAAPWASRSLTAMLQYLTQANPGTSLRPGTVHEFGNIKLAAREISARGDHLRGVLLWIPDLGHTIFAKRGLLEPLPDGSAQLLLQDVEMLTPPHRSRGSTLMRSDTFSTILPYDPEPVRKERASLQEVSLTQLAQLAHTNADGSITARHALIELHRRFSYPVASLAFGLLVVPLALCGRRSSRPLGAVVGLLVIVVYYGLIQLGEGLIQAGVLSIGFGVWLPNLTMGACAFVFLWQNRLRQFWSRRGSNAALLTQTPASSTPPLPHRRRYLLQRYVASQYMQMLGLSFALLLTGYLLVDILERLERFARFQADVFSVMQFYSARIPLLASRVVPMALLLATALTVSMFTVHRELIAVRTCGVSATRILAILLLICGIIMPGYFLLNEVIVPRSNILAAHLNETAIKKRGPEATILHMAIWYRAGTHVYQATQLDAKLGEAQGLAIYEFGQDELPISRTDARVARHVGNGMWELSDPVRVEISDQGLRETPAPSLVRLGEAPSTTVDTTQLGAWPLAQLIHDTESQGYDTTQYRVDLHVKLASPFACVLLPAVALFFAVSGPPFPSPALTVLASTGLGIGYILFTGVCVSLGYGGFIPPSAAGWGPPSLLVVLASFAAVRG